MQKIESLLSEYLFLCLSNKNPFEFLTVHMRGHELQYETRHEGWDGNMNVGVRENGIAKYSQDREAHSLPPTLTPHSMRLRAKIYNKSVF
jgi:hypothetical protein